MKLESPRVIELRLPFRGSLSQVLDRCLADVLGFHNVEPAPRSDCPVKQAGRVDGRFTRNRREHGQSLQILRGEPATSSDVVFRIILFAVAPETAWPSKPDVACTI